MNTNDLNNMLEQVVAGILHMIKEFFVGVFYGIGKLRFWKNLVLFGVSLLISFLTYRIFKDHIFRLDMPEYMNYLIYYLLIALPLLFLFVSGKAGYKGKGEFDSIFAEIDFKGRNGQYPVFCGRQMEGKKTIYTFKSNIPLDEWKNRKAGLETGLDCTILRIDNGKSKRIVRLTTISSDYKIPEMIKWQDSYLKQDDGVVTVGQSALGEITFNLNRTPHVLAAGETGSGKSVVLRTIMWELINQGSRVYMLDFKGGVEFGIDYERYGEVVTDKHRALEILCVLEKENALRLDLFRSMRVKNIVEYNKKSGKNLCRIGVVVDELAEMMDKTGAGKEEKELMSKIEGKLSTLARLSRATGINLILGMQRPDAKVLTGQIKNNIPIRISGRFADKTASEIVLGNTDACNIPDIRGRFMYKVGNETEEFQAYYFDDETMLKDVFVEVGGMLLDEKKESRKTAEWEPVKKIRPEPAEPKQAESKPVRKTKKALFSKIEKEEPFSDREALLGDFSGMNEKEQAEAMQKMDEYDLNLNFEFEEGE